MLQVGRRLDLGQKALAANHRCQVRLQDLHGDSPPVPHVLGQIDRGHSTAAELPVDPVAAFERSVEGGNRGSVTHGVKM